MMSASDILRTSNRDKQEEVLNKMLEDEEEVEMPLLGGPAVAGAVVPPSKALSVSESKSSEDDSDQTQYIYEQIMLFIKYGMEAGKAM